MEHEVMTQVLSPSPAFTYKLSNVELQRAIEIVSRPFPVAVGKLRNLNIVGGGIAQDPQFAGNAALPDGHITGQEVAIFQRFKGPVTVRKRAALFS